VSALSEDQWDILEPGRLIPKTIAQWYEKVSSGISKKRKNTGDRRRLRITDVPEILLVTH